MPYIRRNQAGDIIGAFSVPQGDDSREFLPEDHTDIIAYRAPKVEAPGDRVERGITGNPTMDALIQRIAQKENISERVLIDELRALERSN